MLTDRSHDSHGSIKALRCHKNSVSLRQKSGQVVLYACLSKASCYTDNSKSRMLPEYPLGIIDKPLIYPVLDRLVDEIRQSRNKR